MVKGEFQMRATSDKASIKDFLWKIKTKNGLKILREEREKRRIFCEKFVIGGIHFNITTSQYTLRANIKMGAVEYKFVSTRIMRITGILATTMKLIVIWVAHIAV